MASDADDSGDEDFEALESIRRACIFTGTDPKSFRSSSAADVDDDEDEDEDDFGLVRGIRQRFNAFCSKAGDEAPLTLKPLNILLPSMDDDDDDDEDDFAILRRIQKRFSCYDQDTDGLESSKEKQEQVRSKSTYLEKEALCSVNSDKINASEPVPDSFDTHINLDTRETLDTTTPDTFPSCLTEAYETDTRDLVMVSDEGCGFPKAAQMFVEAIRKNRACQKFIRNKMMQTESRIEENKKLQHRVKIMRGFQIRCKKLTSRAFSQQQDAHTQLISSSKTKGKSKINGKKDSALCHGPAENSHVASYRMVLSEYQISLNRRKWTDEERHNLAKGIKQQFQELLLQKSVDSISEMMGDSDEVDSLYASIRERDITAEDMRLFVPKVNWDSLASMYVKGRSGAECEARWLNWEDPLINHKPWSKSEDKKLLHIVQQRGISNWIEVAVLLETNRTPFQCLARYQRSLNASVLRSEWSKDEDDKLRAAVIAFGESNWENVAATLVGRTGPQCSNRWIKSLNPARERTGRWSADEDKRVKVAVAFFGPKNWRKVAQFVPGRTHVQCRERWANNLDPSLNLGEWTEEEDSKLKAAIEEHGYCWSKVAACVSSRTDNQCTRRWKTLFPREVPLLQAARKIQKAALISNFVDRESERPTLGPSDFVPLRLVTNTDPESGELTQSGKQRRKRRSKKTMEETQLCSDEVPSIAGVDVENVSREKSNAKKKLTPRRCKKNKNVSEGIEDARVGEEILPVDVETGKKAPRKEKMASRSKKATKEAPIGSAEILLPNDVDVEKVAGKKVNSKKKPTLRRRNNNNNGASEVTEDARVGRELPTKKKKTTGEIKMALRSKKATKEAQVLTNETLLTNSVDVDKVAGERTNSKKKPTPRRLKKNNGVSEAESAKVGQENVPFHGERKKKNTSRNSKMVLRERLKDKDTATEVERATKPLPKKTSTETNSRVSTCGDSEVFNMTNIDEVQEHIGDRRGKKNRKSSQNKKNEQCKRYNEAASSFGENEAFSEVRRFSLPHLEQDWLVDPTEVNSSPYPNSNSLRITNINDGKKGKYSTMSCSRRIKNSALMREVSHITEISDSETLGSMVLKKREMRHSLKKRSGPDNSSIKSGPMIHKKVHTIEERAFLEISRAGESCVGSARDDSGSCRKRKGSKPRSSKSNFSTVDGGSKRKRSSIEEQLSNGTKLGEGDDMTLASFIKNRRKKRKLNLAPTTPPLIEFSNEPSRIGWI